jgi:hypothetical protein
LISSPGDAPVGQPVGLVVEDVLERVEAPRLGRRAVEEAQVLVDPVAQVGAGLEERRQPPLGHFFLSRPLGDGAGSHLVARRHLLERGDDAEQLVDVEIVAHPLAQLGQAVAEDARHGARATGKTCSW